MDNLDKHIRDALGPANQTLIGDPDKDLRIDRLVISAFKTRNKFFTALAVLYSLIFCGLGIWCAIRFFASTEIKHTLAWGFGFSFCMLVVGLVKIWFWMEMHRIAVTREVKRVELIAAKLLERLSHNK